MNRIFKVVFNHVLGRHVVVSEVVSSIQRGALKVIAIAVAASCLGLPAYAKTYEVDSVSEDDFKSGVSVEHTTYIPGVNSNTGKTDLGIETKTASGLQTVTVGINATHAYLPNGKLVLVQESDVPSNENYNTYVGRFHTLEKTESQQVGLITNKGAISKKYLEAGASLSDDSAMNADGTEFTGTYTAPDGSVYSVVGKRGEKQSNGLYAWTTTITDQYGNSFTSSSINYMSIETPPADVTNVYTVTAKYEGGEWTTSIVDQNGDAPTNPKMTEISEPVENKKLDMNIGEVNKKTNGYFMTNTIKTTGQITGTVDEKTATVQTGDVVKASITNRNGKPDILTVTVNGESTQFTDDYVKEGTLKTKASDSSNETVTTFKNTDGTSFDVKGENTYVAKGELTQGATDTSNETQTTFTRNDGTTFTVSGEDTYVVKGEVTTKASDTSDKVVTTFTRNDGTTFDVEGNNTYVAKAEVTQEATDDSADVKVQLTRNDGKSFDLDLKDRYVAKAEVTQAATDESDKVNVQMSRNDGKSFDLALNNTYVAKAEVTQQATDTNDDVTIQLSRNDGKSFELATKNTYLADAELKDHTLTLSRNDGTEFSVKDIATLDDGMTYTGDSGSADVKLNSTVSVVGGAKGALTEGNIGVVAEQDGDNAKLTVKLAKDIKDVDSITVNKSVTVGNTKIEDNKVTVGDTVVDNSSVTTKTVNATDVKATTVTADSFYAGDNIFNSSGLSVGGGNVTVTNKGFVVQGGPSMTSSGINAGGKKITNVAAGTAPTDAVNVSQLESSNQHHEANFRRLMHKDAQLERKIHRTGAHAAALAALHPLDFDEDHKLTASAGVGSYHGSNAIAAGVFYRPDENKMFSLGVSLNESDSMVNAGFSYRFGTGSNDKTSPNNIHELKRRVSDLSQDNQSLTAELSSTSQRLASADKEIASLKDEIAQIKKMLKGMKK